MRTPAEISTAGAVGEPGAIARTIIYSVLISAGVVLLNIGWGRLEVAITQLLALLLAYACGVALMRLLAAKKQRTLAALWQSLLLSAVGLLLVLLGRNDWLMMLPGIVIGGIGLGSASRVTTVLLQPLAHISVVAGVASLAVIGVVLSVTLLIHAQASPNFAIAWLIDLLLLGALVVRIAEREGPSPQPWS
ncbi:hypothetical protein NJH77_18385 [Serratia fonticola]|uniref:hypothetical protein n=1 Tax=Serratia fonticola TaxID=47917 RepID=UPI002096A552|nr:hypothetical protein [Serratia fonticola]MCO7511213.1 hypothetical protein [Serratia fonticola]